MKNQMNFPKRADLFREKMLLKHLIKVWNASSSQNYKFRGKVFDKADFFISKIYGKEWMELINDSEKFYEFMDKEEEHNEWLEKACKELLKKEK